MYPSKNEFKKDNRVYYERNTYFDLVDGKKGGEIQNAKVKYLQYQIVNSNFLLDSLSEKEIDVGNVNATAANVKRINGIDYLKGDTTRTNGYGYVGINGRQNRRRLDAPRDHEGDGHLDYQQRIL